MPTNRDILKLQLTATILYFKVRFDHAPLPGASCRVKLNSVSNSIYERFVDMKYCSNLWVIECNQVENITSC